eukprot:10133616-Prorocentrum_lima.AAC.1
MKLFVHTTASASFISSSVPFLPPARPYILGVGGVVPLIVWQLYLGILLVGSPFKGIGSRVRYTSAA